MKQKYRVTLEYNDRYRKSFIRTSFISLLLFLQRYEIIILTYFLLTCDEMTEQESELNYTSSWEA